MKLLVNVKINDKQLDELRKLSPELEIVRELDSQRARDEMRDAEILYAFKLPGPLEEAKKLKWIQLVSAGADHIMDAGVGETDIMVTTASGIHGAAMVEYTICMMVMLARRIPMVLKESQQKQWKPGRLRLYYGDELYGKTLGILGLGTIGQRVATVAKALGMKVIGLRRSGQTGEKSETVDEVYSPEGIMEMLPQCDFVLVVVPFTAETRNMIGEKELRAMKPTAHLINVARGEIVDEAALAKALQEGWIAGAAFDVFAKEPLPPESELWDIPNLIITPHLAGNTIPYMDRATELFQDNLRRYLAGEPMINVLDKSLGY